VSSRFVALTEKHVDERLSEPIANLDIRVVMIDGKAFRDHCMLIAIGLDSSGKKHVLGVREGTTENSGGVRRAGRTIPGESLKGSTRFGLRTALDAGLCETAAPVAEKCWPIWSTHLAPR
jgi:hypothetical protein